MSVRDLIPWMLLLCALVTFFLLLERRRRNRVNLLDVWAGRNGLLLEREVGLGALASLEPLTLVAPVVDIDRLWHGRLALPSLTRHMDVWLSSCLAGTQHRPRRILLGILDGPPELPHLRVLPSSDHAAPSNLGFIELPGDELPAGYRLEAFAPLPQPVVRAVGEALAAVSTTHSDWRIELRPGRLLLATPAHDATDADRLLELATELFVRLAEPTQYPVFADPPMLRTTLN
jgi:hypothetical protein